MHSVFGCFGSALTADNSENWLTWQGANVRVQQIGSIRPDKLKAKKAAAAAKKGGEHLPKHRCGVCALEGLFTKGFWARSRQRRQQQ
jgi:hypothetical protein